MVDPHYAGNADYQDLHGIGRAPEFSRAIQDQGGSDRRAHAAKIFFLRRQELRRARAVNSHSVFEAGAKRISDR